MLSALLGIMGWSAQAPQSILRVKVRDSESQLLRSIEEPSALAQFATLWQTRRKVHSGPSRYPLKLFIESGQESGTWLYHPDGFTIPLSMRAGRVHVIPEASSFNALLGLCDASGTQRRP